MANIKISDLTSAAAATGTQQFEVNESGTSKKVTGAQLATYIESEISSSPTFTGQVSVDAGSASAPSITKTGDSNTGIYFPAADTIALSTGGTFRLTVDSSGNTSLVGGLTSGAVTTGNITSTGTISTTGTIELGHASDTTLSRSAAGVIAVEGGIIPKENRANTFTATQTFSNGIAPGFLINKQNTTGEGGEFQLEKSNTSTLSGNLIVDLAGNTLRFFENGGTFRGAYVDITSQGSQSKILTTANAGTDYVVGTDRSNWNSVSGVSVVVGQLGWKNYGNNHTIFDASNATSPTGSAISNTNADVAWTGTYPMLVGWNGTNTYGVKVDTARYSDSVSTSGALNATAAASVGAVGTYAMLRFIAATAASPGSTHSGSSLYYANSNGGTPGSVSPSGTWRLMGATNSGATNDTFTSLFLRIS